MQLTVERPLGFYKIEKDVKDPVVGTQASACFDLHAYLPEGCEVNAYTSTNQKVTVSPVNDEIVVEPGWRILIPTGLIFDIPRNCSVRLHPRSGLSYKQGIVLANSEGVIDADYVDPVFAMIYNMTDVRVKIKNGDRVVQAELVYQPHFALMQLPSAPGQKTDRAGGFGSTGV